MDKLMQKCKFIKEVYILLLPTKVDQICTNIITRREKKYKV